jgi:hypothetical protein
MLGQDTTSIPGLPIELLTSILRESVGDPAATIFDCEWAPLPHQGTNDSATLLRAELSWSGAQLATERATWIIKHWRAGGLRDRALGIDQPHDVLAWERGWLRPSALPHGLSVPILAAWRSPDASEAWIVMSDVSPELSAYSRMGLSGDEAMTHTRAMLRRLARFHALWERPERQAELEACPWLPGPERFLWQGAAAYARALRRPVATPATRATNEPQPSEELAANLDAFLGGRPPAERRLWEELLVDRGALMEGLASYRHTLLHNDLDDRNLGLRWPDGGAPDLVLIDWEWIGRGPAALDAANLVQRLPVIVRPGSAVPAAAWSDALADEYFAYYSAAGGRFVDAPAWRRTYGMALVTHGLAEMPVIHGALRRAIRGEVPPPAVLGVPEAVMRQILRDGLPTMELMEQRVIGEARMWLG